MVRSSRPEDTIYCGNRFMIYALFPECNISIHLIWGVKKQNTFFVIRKSIFDRSNPVDIGALSLENGGRSIRQLTCARLQIPRPIAFSKSL